MPRANPLQAAFNAGEIGPRLAARVDFAKYGHAAARVENLIPLPQGGLTRRPGTRFVAAAADHDRRPRLLPFEFSTEQAYVLEAGEGRFRFFRDRGQIVVPPNDASVVNGGFDDDIAGWEDRSTGGAAIGHAVLGAGGIDTLIFAGIVARQWGDNAAERRHIAFRWTAAESGDVRSVAIVIGTVTTGFTAVASIWSDSAGSPGTQIGAGSDPQAVAAEGVQTFSFPAKPAIVAGNPYWVVISDTSGGLVTVSLCADQGSDFASGSGDSVTAITDIGPGGVPLASEELRIKVVVETAASNGALALVGSAGGVAAAEQTIATGSPGVEHVLRFRVIGLAGDKALLRLGNTTGGDQVLRDVEVAAGYHAIAFTPAASPIFVQFRNATDKTVHIDDVAMTGAGAVGAVPLELSTPYQAADLDRLKWAQSADVPLYGVGSWVPLK